MNTKKTIKKKKKNSHSIESNQKAILITNKTAFSVKVNSLIKYNFLLS